MKNELLAELLGSAHEALDHAQGKRSLRTTTLPLPPKALNGRAVKRLRATLHASQAVFARGCFEGVGSQTVSHTADVVGPIDVVGFPDNLGGGGRVTVEPITISPDVANPPHRLSSAARMAPHPRFSGSYLRRRPDRPEKL